MILTTKQTIAILLALLIALALFSPKLLEIRDGDLYIIAICFAAFLPAGAFQVARITKEPSLLLALVISLSVGGLWYFIIQKIYPTSALIFSAAVSCGSYLMFRIK